MEDSVQEKFSPRTSKILSVLVATAFVGMSSVLLYLSLNRVWEVYTNHTEVIGVVTAKEYNSVEQTTFYMVQYQWEERKFYTENRSRISDHSVGDSIRLDISNRQPSIAILQEEKTGVKLFFSFLFFVFCIVFGGYLVKKAFKRHE
jgi:hypothetical protein